VAVRILIEAIASRMHDEKRPGDGKEVRLLTADLNGPNGLAFSPDEKYFYVDN